MSASVVNNNAPSILGRMFARQNVHSVYGRQRAAGQAEPDTFAERVDKVSLSALAPKPLDGGLLRDAFDAGQTLAESGELSEESADRLRQDRIFAAVSVLALMGHDGTAPVTWPGGFQSPTREELEMARRRLAQRPDNLAETENADELQNRRLELVQKLSRRDFSLIDLSVTAETVPKPSS